MNNYNPRIIFWTKSSSHFVIREITAFAASIPFFLRAFACFIFKHVKIPFPIGFLDITERFIIAFVEACEIKSKCGVCPFITHPRAIKASYLFKFLDIVTVFQKHLGLLLF